MSSSHASSRLANDTSLRTDVPLGGALAAVKKLEVKLGIDLTSPSSEANDMAKL